MATLENFSKAIDLRLAEQLRLRREKQHRIDHDMESLPQRQTAYHEIAQGILHRSFTPEFRHFASILAMPRLKIATRPRT